MQDHAVRVDLAHGVVFRLGDQKSTIARDRDPERIMQRRRRRGSIVAGGPEGTLPATRVITRSADTIRTT